MLSVVCPHPLPQEGPRVRWLYDVFEYWKQTFVILVFLFVVCVSGMAFAILMVTLYCYYRPQPNKWTLNWTAVSVLFNGNTNPTPRHFKTRLLETTSSLLLLFFFLSAFMLMSLSIFLLFFIHLGSAIYQELLQCVFVLEMVSLKNNTSWIFGFINISLHAVFNNTVQRERCFFFFFSLSHFVFCHDGQIPSIECVFQEANQKYCSFNFLCFPSELNIYTSLKNVPD